MTLTTITIIIIIIKKLKKKKLKQVHLSNLYTYLLWLLSRKLPWLTADAHDEAKKKLHPSINAKTYTVPSEHSSPRSVIGILVIESFCAS